MEKRLPLSVILLVLAGLTFGCIGLSSPGLQPTPLPAPTVAVPLTLAINTTPPRYNPAMSSTIGIRLVAVNSSGIIPPDAQFTWETNFGMTAEYPLILWFGP